ncbi:MAG: EamA family transporter [Maribacter sp.]|nr:EamA family transporter [Maribacter sp.]
MTNREKSQSPLLIVLAFFSIYVIWGSTYLLNKIAVAELPPFILAGIRFGFAGISIFGIAKLGSLDKANGLLFSKALPPE